MRSLLLLSLLVTTGCVHATATFPFAGIRSELQALRVGGTEIPGARPRDARLTLDDHVTITNGDELTVRELVAPCLLATSDAPDSPHCPLQDDGAATRVTEDPGATLLLWSVLTLGVALLGGLVGCAAACHDVGLQVVSGVGLVAALLGGSIALLSFLGP